MKYLLCLLILVCQPVSAQIPGGGGLGAVPPSYLNTIKVMDRHSGVGWMGSGSFLTDRLVLTCAHNVRGIKSNHQLSVNSAAGAVYTDVEIVQVSPKLDLALLLIRDERVEYHRTLRVSGALSEPTGAVQSMGYNPGERALCLYSGVMFEKSYSNGSGMTDVFNSHGAKVVQGMSGGPLLNEDGLIVGVNTHTAVDGSFALSVKLYRIQWFLTEYQKEVEAVESEGSGVLAR